MSLYGRIEELEEQLDKAEKQNVLLRELLEIVQERGDLYSGDHAAIRKALDATADLAGLVVCDAVPVFLFRRKGVSKDFCTCDKNRFAELSQMPNLFEMKKLYQAKEPK